VPFAEQARFARCTFTPAPVQVAFSADRARMQAMLDI
jgi:hypothetical protein